MNRRDFLAHAAALAALPLVPAAAQTAQRAGAFGLDAAQLGVRPGADDGGRALQSAVERAARAEQPLFLGPGRYQASNLALPTGARLIGVPGATRLVATDNGPAVSAKGARRVALEGIALDGLKRTGRGEDAGLAAFEGIERLDIANCEFVDGGGHGLLVERSGGSVKNCRLSGHRETGLRGLDNAGLAILDNEISACGNNGIQVWRSVKGFDGGIVRGNRIADIRADRGGTGPYGNGISLFRASGVTVDANAIRGCKFTAVRNNGGADVIVTGNACLTLGECAIFAEFGFDGAIVANNLIDGAVSGIQTTNFADAGGRLASVTGNLIRNIRPTDVSGGRGFGYEAAIKVEADTAVTGNVIDGAPWVGILVGWARSLRDVTVSGNVVRGVPIGIGATVVAGAGTASITGNMISGASKGAVVGLEWEKAVTGDLTRDGAARFSNLTIANNRAS